MSALWLAGGLIAAQNYDELFRPQFHFTPARNWMNDPNGLVFYKGEYHLYFQYNPFDNVWGHMSWGHAVSRDMVHWQQLPVALPEAEGVMIFSGSVVVDERNSSGFCRGGQGGDPSCLVAVYTGYTGKEQNQNLSYSNDRGRTWSKYAGNPVIDLHLADFRDPKVFWDAARQHWVMVTALSPQHKLRFFSSADLKYWNILSDFGPAGAVGGAWECPDLFPLPVDGEPGQVRWVLSVNINPGGVAGGSGNQYFIGQFDGTKFINENPADQILWADYGKDFYASTSFFGIPPSDGRRIWMGWLDNWEYAGKEPTRPWRGTQSIPRALALRRYPEGIRLVQEPVRELQALRGAHEAITLESTEGANRLLKSKGVAGETLEIVAEIEPGKAAEFGLKVRQGAREETVIGIDMAKSELFVDRTQSGNTEFDNRFPGRQSAPIHLKAKSRVMLHVYVDRSSVEAFANDGEAVISDRIYPSPGSTGIELYSSHYGTQVIRLDTWVLKPVWHDALVVTK